jgi:hypothetical protein
VVGHHAHRPATVPGRRDERGVVLAVVAAAMVAVLILVAIVVDLGYVRGGAGFDQSSADLAALAASEGLANKEYVEACKAIVTYVNTNAGLGSGLNGNSICAGFGSTTCSGGGTTQAVGTGTSGAYRLTVKFPIPDGEIADSTFGAGKVDGLACERIKVSLTSTQPSFFGGILGRDGYTITRSATVRGGKSQTRLVPALWLLDPVGCVVLSVQGGSRVTAGNATSSPPIPGVITLDSDGTSGCSSTKTTMDAGGTGTQIRAVPLTGNPGQRGEISLHAMPWSSTTCTGTFACQQSQVGSQVLPQPIPSPERATRAPVDWLWNCKASYPNYFGVVVAPCPSTSTREPYIDKLKAAIGTSGAPTGFQRWSTAHGCSPSGTITATGNWWVDCPGGLSMTNGTTVNITGGNVIFDGGIKLNSGAALNVNANNPTSHLPLTCTPPSTSAPCIGQSSARASFIYVRGGDWNLGGGTFNGKQTVVYLGGNSVVKATGGAPPKWSAPIEGPFAGLSLWAESPGAFNISGGAGVALSGTFFTPFANDLSLSGGGNWGQQNAQFISYRLTVTGGSILELAPDPNTAVLLPPPAATLIR